MIVVDKEEEGALSQSRTGGPRDGKRTSYAETGWRPHCSLSMVKPVPQHAERNADEADKAAPDGLVIVRCRN